MDEQFKPGDVVQLKSGGPAMTVRSIADIPSSDGAATVQSLCCVWYAGEGQGYSTSFFDPACLDKVVE